jgi:hypothetical protein
LANERNSEISLEKLPNYRFSKFQQVLPDQFALEMVKGYLLDIDEISKLTLPSQKAPKKSRSKQITDTQTLP